LGARCYEAFDEICPGALKHIIDDVEAFLDLLPDSKMRRMIYDESGR